MGRLSYYKATTSSPFNPQRSKPPGVDVPQPFVGTEHTKSQNIRGTGNIRVANCPLVGLTRASGDRDTQHIRQLSSLNIVLFGEIGVGKSSVINLIAGRAIARTSPDAQVCTMSLEQCDFSIKGRTLRIWETVGSNVPVPDVFGADDYLSVIEQAWDLIQQLSSQGGVDLLLFCVKGMRFSATTQSNYKLFYEVLCRSQVPMALVITYLERETQLENWWERNADRIVEKYGFKSAGHACVTGLARHSKYEESQRNMAMLLEKHKGGESFNMPPDKWFIEFLRGFGPLYTLKEASKRKDIIKVLTKRCGLDLQTAKHVAEEVEGGA